MKKLIIIVLSTLVLAGCTPMEGILTTQDVNNIKYEDIKDILHKQNDIFYTSEEVKEAISRIKSIREEIEDDRDETMIEGDREKFRHSINSIDEEIQSHEFRINPYSSESEIKYFNKVVDVLDETIAKGIKEYIEENRNLNEEITKNDIIGRVAVNIDNRNQDDDKVAAEATKNKNGTYIKISINLRDIKDKEYLNLVNSIKTKDFLVNDIKIGKYQDFIKLNNASYIKDDRVEYRDLTNSNLKLPPQVSYEIFTQGKDVEKVRLVIIKHKDSNIEEKDMEPLKNISSILRFDAEDTKKLTDITSNINKDKQGKKKLSTDKFEYRYSNMEKMNKNVGRKENIIEIIIEKKSK